MRIGIGLLALAVLSAPLIGFADGPAAKLDTGDGFRAFCGQWMQKLAERERSNLSSAKPTRVADRVVVEYTGYASQPVSCQSRVAQPGRPGVGVMVYHELRYRRSGDSQADARTGSPEVVEKVEVTEVFRYDGARWSY